MPHIHELAIGIAAYTCTCQRHCRIYMNLAAALPHIHELVSGIAAYTYTSSRVNVSSAATTVQVVALYSKVLFRKQWQRHWRFSQTRRAGPQPGTRMPTKRAGGWLEEGANGRGTVVNAEIFTFLTRSASDRQTQRFESSPSRLRMYVHVHCVMYIMR